jgi:hypothetical protein
MIKQTTNYQLFKKHESNRAIDETNLKKLRNSVQSRNLLEYRPILVDVNFRIIDGQHRLEIAKELQLPIYYQVQEDLKDEDIILLNANQKNWGFDDYLNFFMNKGYEHYIRLNQYCLKHKLTPTLAMITLKSKDSRKNDLFKRGKFVFVEDNVFQGEIIIEKIKSIIDYIDDNLPEDKLHRKFIHGARFHTALVEFLSRSDIEIDRFMNSLQVKLSWIRPVANTKEFGLIFKNIYNYKNIAPIQ